MNITNSVIAEGGSAVQAIVQVGGTTNAAKIYAAMLKQIAKHQFQVVQRYPRDLECDYRKLCAVAHPGAQIAWVVGHSHTHLVVLGLEAEQNELVESLVTLSSTDRYYLIKVGASEVSITERTRADFAQLVSTKIPYTSSGGNYAFTIRKEGHPLVDCAMERTGTYDRVLYKVKISQRTQITPLDRVAIEYWCHRAVATCSGSLFTKRDLMWEPFSPSNARYDCLAA